MANEAYRQRDLCTVSRLTGAIDHILWITQLLGVLTTVVIAAVVGFSAVLVLGDAYFRVVGAIDYTTLSVCVLGLLCVVSYLFTGPIGIGVFAAITVVGLLPVWLTVQRAHLMGVLLGPLILGW